MGKKQSKLSRGPKNPRHTIFLRNEKLIREALNKIIAKRLIYVRARDICRHIKITRPTFYLHCRNCNHALMVYEQSLFEEFCESVSRTQKREVAVTLLLGFIQTHSGYFAATTEACSNYVLLRMLRQIRPILVGDNISDQAFRVYAGSLSAIIDCWGEHEHYSSQSLPRYTKKILHTRVMAF